jgi:hypothetical protein
MSGTAQTAIHPSPQHWEKVRRACELAQDGNFHGELRFHFQEGRLVRFDIFQRNKIESTADLEEKLRTIPLI